ncbi:MAG: sulfite exporter TauE/SafE family protein [Mycobacteriales bacterium]
MILGAVALGVLIGLSLGALGGGGSILTVPALVFVLGLTAQEATTGSLVIVGVTAAAASAGHARAGHTLWVRGALLALAGVPASVLGSSLNRSVDPNVLLLAFAVLMVVAAAGMLARARPRTEAPGASVAAATRTAAGQSSAPATAAKVVVAGLGIGFLTGFLGVGGGFIIVPVLVVLLRYDMPDAIGTSLLVIALNSAVALGARAGHGGFVWHVIVPFTLAAVVGSFAGRRVADRLDAATLTRAFAVLLLAVAGYVAVRAGLGTV